MAPKVLIDPGEENVVVQVATPPPLRDCAPQPEIVVPPLTKLTVPVGKIPGPVTVAVRVSVAPTVTGEGDSASVVLEAALVTVKERGPVDPL